MRHKNKYSACSCIATGNSSRRLLMLNISDKLKIILWFKCKSQNKKQKIMLQSEAGCSSDDREAAAAGESTLPLCSRPTGRGEAGRQRSGGGIRAAPCRRCWHEALCCGIFLTPPPWRAAKLQLRCLTTLQCPTFPRIPPDCMNPVTVKLFY